MGNLTIIERLKEIVAGISFKVFLWSINMSAEQYWFEVWKDENAHRRQ